MSTKILIPALLLLLALPAGLCRADDAQASKEARLREALQSSYGLLRTAQDQNATLQAAQADSQKQIVALKQEIQTATDQLKAETTKNTLAMQTAQSQIDQFKIQVVELQRKIDEDERRNIALFQLANEILTRYEKFGLGEALAAKEPFTGLTRVNLENLVQGYEDKIIAGKYTTPLPPSTVSSTNAPSGQKPAEKSDSSTNAPSSQKPATK